MCVRLPPFIDGVPVPMGHQLGPKALAWRATRGCFITVWQPGQKERALVALPESSSSVASHRDAMPATRILLVCLTALAAVTAGCFGHSTSNKAGEAGSATTGHAAIFQSVLTNAGGFEPRIAVGPDGTRWVSTANTMGDEVVYKSTDGLNWTKTTDPQVIMANADNEIIVTPTGRVITATIAQGVTFDMHFTDDGGKPGTQSVWLPPEDT